MVAGLAHLHSGGGGALERRMHRNIKPANILLNARGEAKITDLGQVQESGKDNKRVVKITDLGQVQESSLKVRIGTRVD